MTLRGQIHGDPNPIRDMQRVRETRAEKRLRGQGAPRATPLYRHENGGGLRLVVEPPTDKKTPGARRWVPRVTIGGERYNRELGPYPLISLDGAPEHNGSSPA
jgi:hypothetical protein